MRTTNTFSKNHILNAAHPKMRDEFLKTEDEKVFNSDMAYREEVLNYYLKTGDTLRK